MNFVNWENNDLAFWFLDNLTKTLILSPWYYDIPTTTFLEDNDNFGVVKLNKRLEVYEVITASILINYQVC
jgi:hypothetical protein